MDDSLVAIVRLTRCQRHAACSIELARARMEWQETISGSVLGASCGGGISRVRAVVHHASCRVAVQLKATAT